MLERAARGELPDLAAGKGTQISVQSIPDVAVLAEPQRRTALIEQTFAPVADMGSDRLGTLRTGVLEELFKNQLLHGPQGTALQVTLSQEGEELRLVLRDDAGAFRADALAEVMVRLAKEEGHTVAQHGAGAGLGLVMVLDSCSLLELVIDPGRSTQVAVEFPQSGSVGALRRQGKSLNVYASEES